MSLENSEMLITASAGFIGLLSLVLSLIVYRKCKKQRDLLESVDKQNTDMEDSLAKTNELLENSQQRATDLARRIAWLEMRIRQPRSAQEKVVVDDVEPSKPIKSNITERRHRVLSLSSRGQSPEKIASTLGMMLGEVELIIKLSRSNFVTN